MNDVYLDFETKHKVIVKHVKDFIDNDGLKPLEFFSPYYFNSIYNRFKKINNIYNTLNTEDKEEFVSCILFTYSKESNEIQKKNHDIYMEKYFPKLVFSTQEFRSPYDDLKYSKIFPDINAKDFKTELINICLDEFTDRELLSQKRYDIGIVIDKAYLFSKIDNPNDVLWISVDFHNRRLDAGFGRKDYSIYTNYYFYLFGGDFARDILTIDELKIKVKTLCRWLLFMYPRYRKLFDELVCKIEKKNRSESK